MLTFCCNIQGSISLGAVKLIVNNIAVSNGMVHVIDAVLKPPELDPIVNRTCPNVTRETMQVSNIDVVIILNILYLSPSWPVGVALEYQIVHLDMRTV